MAADAMTIDSKESTAALIDESKTADDQDDPITASYQVFLNPSLPLGRRLLVLQHPNRTDSAPRPPPVELRLKSGAGMVEVDMPLDTGTAYDREKGLDWGRKFKASMTLKNGGTHGLAGGFGSGAVQQRGGAAGGGRGKGKQDDDDVGLDWAEAVRQDKVLRTQTLGGQYPDSKEVQYMVGVFQGSESILTANDLHMTAILTMGRKPSPHTSFIPRPPPSAAPPHRRDDAPREALQLERLCCRRSILGLRRCLRRRPRHSHDRQDHRRGRGPLHRDDGRQAPPCAGRALAQDAVH